MTEANAAVLTTLAIVAACLGYGHSALRLLGAREARLPLAIMAGAGLALLAALAGWIVAARLFSRGAGLLLLAPGIVLLALSARELFQRLRWRISAGSLAFFTLAALVFVPRALGAVHVIKVNACDDWVAYYHLPKLLLETGALDEPFSFRRLGTLGVGPLLQSYYFPLWQSAGVRVADAVLGGLLVWGAARSMASLATPLASATRVELLGLLGAVMSLTIPVANASPVLLPLGGTLLLLWLSAALFREREATPAGLAIAVFWGATAAFVTELRTSNVAFPGFLGMAGLAFALARRDTRAIRLWLLAALAFAVALAPWSLASWHSSGTPFFPLIRGNYRFPSGLLEPLSAADQLALVATALWASRIWLPLLLAGLTARAPALAAAALSSTAALVGTVVATALAFSASDDLNVHRYLAPFVAATNVFLISAWLTSLRVPGTPARVRALVSAALVVGAAVVWLLLPVRLEVEDAFDPQRAQRKFVPARQIRKNARVALQMADRALQFGAQTAEVRSAALYAAAQDVLDEDAKVLSVVARPFLWRFDRQVVHMLDCPGQASPPPGMPFFQGPDAVAAYLTGLGYTHLAFSPPSRGFCLYSLQAWRIAGRSGHFLWEQWAPYFEDFLTNEQLLARRRRVVYRSPEVIVVDLRETRGPSTERLESSGESTTDRLRHGRRLLEREHVAPAFDPGEVGARDRPLPVLGVHRRHQPVVAPPDEVRLGAQPVETLAEPPVRDREQDLPGRSEPARVSDHEAGERLVVPEVEAGGEGLRARRRVGEQQRRQLPGRRREQVRDRMRVEPEPEGRQQREPVDRPVREAGHLGGDHPAHRVADEVRALDAKRLDDVPAVEREVEHVLEALLAALLAEARPNRREDPEALGQRVEQRLLGQQAARAVQVEKRRAASLLAHAALDAAAGFDRPPAHDRPPFASSGRTRPS